MWTFGEIRAFTTDEIARMQSEIARVSGVIAQKQSDLFDVKANPFNYLVQTQRDAMTRMENAITQDQHVLAQLQDTRDATIESGDTDKLDSWFALSSVVGDASDLATWQAQRQYASTAQTVGTVASETAGQVAGAVKNPLGIPWWAWLVGAGALYIAAAGFGRRR